MAHSILCQGENIKKAAAEVIEEELSSTGDDKKFDEDVDKIMKRLESFRSKITKGESNRNDEKPLPKISVIIDDDAKTFYGTPEDYTKDDKDLSDSDNEESERDDSEPLSAISGWLNWRNEIVEKYSNSQFGKK